MCVCQSILCNSFVLYLTSCHDYKYTISIAECHEAMKHDYILAVVRTVCLDLKLTLRYYRCSIIHTYRQTSLINLM